MSLFYCFFFCTGGVREHTKKVLLWLKVKCLGRVKADYAGHRQAELMFCEFQLRLELLVLLSYTNYHAFVMQVKGCRS